MFLRIYNVEFYVRWILPQLQKKKDLIKWNKRIIKVKKSWKTAVIMWRERGKGEGRKTAIRSNTTTSSKQHTGYTYIWTHTHTYPPTISMRTQRGVLWNALFKSGSCQFCLWSIHGSLNTFSGSWPILKIHNITKWNRNDRLFHVMGVCTVWYNFSVQTM